MLKIGLLSVKGVLCFSHTFLYFCLISAESHITLYHYLMMQCNMWCFVIHLRLYLPHGLIVFYIMSWHVNLKGFFLFTSSVDYYAISLQVWSSWDQILLYVWTDMCVTSQIRIACCVNDILCISAFCSYWQHQKQTGSAKTILARLVLSNVLNLIKL